MNNKRFSIQLTSILLIFLLSACGGDPDDPEGQIKAVIEKVEIAAEERSAKSIREHISDNYSDKHHSNPQQLIRTLIIYFHRNKNIHLFSRISNIEINNQDTTQSTATATATASVNFAMTGTQVDSAEKLLMLKADVFRFDVEFVNTDDQWMVAGAEWRKIQINEFFN